LHFITARVTFYGREYAPISLSATGCFAVLMSELRNALFERELRMRLEMHLQSTTKLHAAERGGPDEITN